jgi:dTDP-4-amino-4,6-dideoxygalactose transaminase
VPASLTHARVARPLPASVPPSALAPVVPYQRPAPPPLDAVAAYYRLSEEARRFSNGGPCAQLLDERAGAYLDAEVACLPLANCTVGLMVALRAALGDPVEGRRHVIVPSFTFTATACAIAWSGFVPLFIDVDTTSWQLDPSELSRVLAEQGDRVAGVLATTTFGTAPPASARAAWRATCDAAGIPLVIDSAAAFGARDEHGRLVGSDGATHVFSFHVTKPFAVGEGGLLVTGDAEVAQRAESLVNFGIDGPERTSAVAGINAKMSELHAAGALAMLDRFEPVLARRRAAVEHLRRLLHGLPVRFQAGAEGSTWQVFQVLMPDGRRRDAALRAAERLRVEARSCFDPPLHRHPAFAEHPVAGDLRGTAHLAARSLSLPMANDLSLDELERIAEVVREGLAG